MKRQLANLVLLCCLLAGSMACASAQETPVFSEGCDGLIALGNYLVQASEEERKALTRSLRPEQEDYALVFQGKFGKRVNKYHRKYWRRHDPVMRPYYETQTEARCWSTTPDSLAMYKGNARQFPGGYREIAQYFQPGIIVYRLKLVKPGMRLGTSFDAFVYVNGRWKIFPRPWVLSDELLRE
ncbi:MAG: hypothetical protein R3B47_05435 [Bacteroidia bacterium]